MSRTKKFVIALAVLTGTIAVCLTAAVLVAPQFVDKGPLGNKLRREVSSLVGGDFDFARISLAVFPTPHAVLVQPQLTVAERFSASVQTIELYPDIISFLSGHMTLKRIVVQRPEATIWMTRSPDSPKKPRLQIGNNELLPSLLKVFSRLSNILLSIDEATVSDGTVKLIHKRTAAPTVNILDAALQNVSGSAMIKATASSDLFKNLNVTGTLRPGPFEGSTHIEITSLDLGAINDIFALGSSLKIDAGTADIALSVAAHKNGQMSLEFKSSAPRIRLAEEGETFDLEILTLAGTAHIGSDSTTAAISDLHLGNPALRVSASAIISENDPRYSFKLQSREIDISSTRSAALALAGANHTVQSIFEIVKSGTIQALTVSSQADTHGGLADLDNLLFKASLADGEIHIPGANLLLGNVSGDVNMSKGVLAGEHVAANWQHSTLHNGAFKVDLSKDPLTLSVETDLGVDVADLPTILEKFIDDQTFSAEMAQIDNLKGSAAGTLSISGNTEQLAISASATDFDISARHPAIPYPLKIRDGVISYDKNRIQAEHLAGSIGASDFDSLSGHIDFGRTRTFEVTSGASRILIKEMLPWISAHRETSKIARYYGGGESILQLTEIQASGSLQDLGQAQFNLTGNLHDLNIENLPRQPGPLEIASLKFSATPQALSFSDVQARMLDGSMTASGTASAAHTAKENKQISLGFEGQLGPQFIDWVTDTYHLPFWLQLRPLVFEKSHLHYSSQGKHRISAALALRDDLELTTEVSIAADTVAVHVLKVKDRLSQASVTAEKTGPLLDLAFAGTLHESSVHEIARIPALLGGSINGKAKISINLENPFEVSLLGKLSGTDLSLHTAANVPLLVNSILVEGEPGNLTLTSADLSWNGAAAAVSGNVKPRAGALPTFTVDVESENLDIDTIMKNITSQSGVKGGKAALDTFSLPIEGEVRLKINKLKAHGYTIEPLQTAYN